MTARRARAGPQPLLPGLVAGGTTRRIRGPDRVDVRGRARGAGRGRGRRRRRPRVRCSYLRTGSKSSSSGTRRRSVPLRTPDVCSLILDTDAPPFDHVEVRRAMNLALDRDRVVQIFGGEASRTTHVSAAPAEFPRVRALLPVHERSGPEGPGALDRRGPGGSPEARPSLGHGGDAGHVRLPALLLGPARSGPRRLPGRPARRLGYHGRVEALPANAFYARGNEFQMALDAWTADYPAASNFITNRFTCDATYIPSAGFCDRKIDAMIERATKMQASDPTAAGALWARIDHSFVDQAPYLWLENPVAVEFISNASATTGGAFSGAACSISSGFGRSRG